MRALEIARGLRETCGAEVRLWTTSSRVPAELGRDHAVEWFAPWRRAQGSLVFIGSFWKPKPWLQRLRPLRLTVIVNDMNVANFRAHLPIYRRMCPDLRIAFTSASQRRLFDAETMGEVHVSPIDLRRFSPAPDRAAVAGQMRLGRHSRDTLDKHQFLYDPDLYKTLAAEGVDIDLMGADCIRHLLPVLPNLCLRPTGSMDAAEYLRGLDGFVYRTGTFYDTAARAVREAMACGLPVVCHRFGGHVENIRHGDNGFVFDDQREALEIIRRLRDDPALRRRVGRSARASMEALFAPERMQAMVRSYLADETRSDRPRVESVVDRR